MIGFINIYEPLGTTRAIVHSIYENFYIRRHQGKVNESFMREQHHKSFNEQGAREGGEQGTQSAGRLARIKRWCEFVLVNPHDDEYREFLENPPHVSKTQLFRLWLHQGAPVWGMDIFRRK